MAFEALLTDALAHAGSGIALALLDFVTSKVANPKTARLARKQKCLASIEVLLDTEDPLPKSPDDESENEAVEVHAVAKDSVQYAEHVTNVQEYLRSSGLVKLQIPLAQRIKDGARNLIFHEKINGLSNMQKLGVAVGVEVIYDTLFGFYYYTSILKQSPVAAIAVNLYQIPALWLGLWLGNGLKKFVDIIITPGEEKKLDRMIQQLLQETNIVEVIVKYQPPEEVKNGLSEQGLEVYAAQLTRAGQGAFKQLKQFAESAKETAGDVLNYQQKHAEKETQEREDRRKRFDDLTKGR